jgi:hypothetical protein
VATIPQTIIDRNGHQKVVHINPDKGVGKLDGGQASHRAIPFAPPARVSQYELTTEDVQKWVSRNNLPLSHDEEFMDLVNAAAQFRGDFTDDGLATAYNQTFADNFGGYTVESLRAALAVGYQSYQEQQNNYKSEPPKVISVNQLSQGMTAPFVMYEDRMYEPLNETMNDRDEQPKEMLLYTSQAFSGDDSDTIAGYIRYGWKAVMHAQGEIGIKQIAPNCFHVDFRESRTPYQGTLEQGFARFEGDVEEYFYNGTPTRQDGTSALDPVAGDALPFRFYYQI